MRGMIRDMMRYHAERFSAPRERTHQARALLDFLAQSVQQEGPYSQLLKNELENLRQQADHYLYHEHLEEINDPMYFHQFAAMAKASGLQYLGEARLGTMVTGNFGPEIEKTLRLLATDQIQAEQYMDFLRNRMFRETLLCKENLKPNWSVNPELVRGLQIASGARPVFPEGSNEVNFSDETPLSFRTASGMNLTTNRPFLKHAMMVLQENFPGTVAFDALRQQTRERLGGGDPLNAKQAGEDSQLLAMGLLNCYLSSDLIEFHGMPINFARTASEKPLALPLARLQAAKTGTCTNRRHEMARLSELDRYLVPMLDGKTDKAKLVEQLADVAVAGNLSVRRAETELKDRGEITTALNSIIDQALANIARMAILQQ